VSFHIEDTSGTRGNVLTVMSMIEVIGATDCAELGARGYEVEPQVFADFHTLEPLSFPMCGNPFLLLRPADTRAVSHSHCVSAVGPVMKKVREESNEL
jgi:hypothetical protein